MEAEKNVPGLAGFLGFVSHSLCVRILDTISFHSVDHFCNKRLVVFPGKYRYGGADLRCFGAGCHKGRQNPMD